MRKITTSKKQRRRQIGKIKTHHYYEVKGWENSKKLFIKKFPSKKRAIKFVKATQRRWERLGLL